MLISEEGKSLWSASEDWGDRSSDSFVGRGFVYHGISAYSVSGQYGGIPTTSGVGNNKKIIPMNSNEVRVEVSAGSPMETARERGRCGRHGTMVPR